MNGAPRQRYAIAAIRERVREHGGPVLDFSVGRHEDAPPAAVDALLRTPGGDLLRGGHLETEGFVAAATGMLRAHYGLDVEPAAVLPVPGGRTAMSFLASALLRPGADVVVTEPSYPAMARVAQQIGADVLSIALDPDRGFAPDASPLGERANPDLSLLALNYPNNPTGAVIAPNDLRELAARLAPGGVLFNDATYGPLTFERGPWSLLAEIDRAAGSYRRLELHSLAKLYAVGAVPVSFLVGDLDLVAELRELSEYAWSDQSALCLRIARACLEDHGYLAEVRRRCRERYAELRDVLDSLGFETFPAAAGMYVFCRAPRAVGGSPVDSAEQATTLLLDRFGLAAVSWDVPPHGYVRFSARFRRDEIEGLAALGRGGPIVSR
jgi:aspartate/methionine/tyrosine aminotransferase